MGKITVTEISASAAEKTVKDFFLFCGKIKEFELVKEETSDKQIAYVTFEKGSAAKTALMLTNAVIGDSPITVRSAGGDSNNSSPEESQYDSNMISISQEEKPKAAVFAEILAAGYQLQDHIIERSLEYDNTYGISQRVKQWISMLQETFQVYDSKYKVVETVTQKASEIDAKFAVQDKVKYAASQAQATATTALNTSIGQKAIEFYSSTTKTVADVHAEARRTADDKRAARETNGHVGAIETH